MSSMSTSTDLACSLSMLFIIISPLQLPATNQTALAAPVNLKLAAKLHCFHLCLLQHPTLLLCTHPNCTHHLPLIPTQGV